MAKERRPTQGRLVHTRVYYNFAVQIGIFTMARVQPIERLLQTIQNASVVSATPDQMTLVSISVHMDTVRSSQLTPEDAKYNIRAIAQFGASRLADGSADVRLAALELTMRDDDVISSAATNILPLLNDPEDSTVIAT